MNTNKSEKGQVLVLILLGIVGLFAFTALAVDMGQIFLARRSAQAAADSAAMAAAMDFATGSKVKATALAKGVAMANTNGYNNDGVTNWVQVLNPPDAGPYSIVDEKNQYYLARIKVKMDPIFAQLFFSGNEETTVEAVVRAKPSQPVTGQDALLAVGTGPTDLLFDGTVDVDIDGGNARSNGGVDQNGNSGSITVHSPGHIYYATTDGSKHPSVYKDATPEQNPSVGTPQVDAPYCPTQNETHDGVDYYYYPSGINDDTHFAPGIHCIEGGINKGRHTGTGVLLVILSGQIKQTGGDGMNIKAASNLIDKNGNQFGGMVVYAPITNTEVMRFGGNSNDYFQGTIYTPGATCDLGGNPEHRAYRAAWTCKSFKYHGGVLFSIDYNPTEQNQTRPIVEPVQ